jgi:uncharacterized membrane protein
MFIIMMIMIMIMIIMIIMIIISTIIMILMWSLAGYERTRSVGRTLKDHAGVFLAYEIEVFTERHPTAGAHVERALVRRGLRSTTNRAFH